MLPAVSRYGHDIDLPDSGEGSGNDGFGESLTGHRDAFTGCRYGGLGIGHGLLRLRVLPRGGF